MARSPVVWKDMGDVPYCGFCGNPMRLLFQTSYFCDCLDLPKGKKEDELNLDFDSLWDDITPVHPDRCLHDAPYSHQGSYWCRRCGKLLATP